jgi:hypothetical protein
MFATLQPNADRAHIITPYQANLHDINTLGSQNISPLVSERHLQIDGRAFHDYPFDVKYTHLEATVVCDGMIVAAGAAIVEGEKDGVVDIRVWGGGTSDENANVHYAYELMRALKDCGIPVFRAIVMKQEGGAARLVLGKGENYNIPDSQKLLEAFGNAVPEVKINSDGRPEITIGYSCGADGAMANATTRALLFDPVGGIPWDEKATGIDSIEFGFMASAAIAVLYELGNTNDRIEYLKAMSFKNIGRIMTDGWVTPYGNPGFFKMLYYLATRNTVFASQSARRLGWPKEAISKIETREPNPGHVKKGNKATIDRLQNNKVKLGTTVSTRGMSTFLFPISRQLHEELNITIRDAQEILTDQNQASKIKEINRIATQVSTALLNMPVPSILLPHSHFTPMQKPYQTMVALLAELENRGEFDQEPNIQEKIKQTSRRITQ